MLVEDDKSLREIYGVRLLAEGYDIVSAGDGEEALAVAIKEKPVLIITDVMMPKISGFDMLDILRSTTETRNIKVIVMTALSSDEQRTRGTQLGADRYLVKSQVGIEDVVRTVHEVLADQVAAPAPPPTPPTVPPAAPPPNVPPTPPPTAPAPPPSVPPQMPIPPSAAPTRSDVPLQAPPRLAPPIAPVPATVTPTAQPISTSPPPPSTRTKVIQPLRDPKTLDIDINDLLNKELAREAGIAMPSIPAPPNQLTPPPAPTTPNSQPAAFSAMAPAAPPAPQPLPPPPTAQPGALPTIQIDAQGNVIMPQGPAPVGGYPAVPPSPPPLVR